MALGRRAARDEVGRPFTGDRRAELPELDAVRVDRDRRDGAGTDARRHEQGGLRHAVGGDERARPESRGGESVGECVERGAAHGLCAGDDTLERREIERSELFVGDEPRAEPIGEVGPHRDRRAVLGDQLEPEQRASEELARRSEDSVAGDRDRLQQLTDKAHVVIVRQPSHQTGGRGDAHGCRDRRLVGDEVAVTHHDTLRHARGAGGVLQQSQGRRVDARQHPLVGVAVERGELHDVGRPDRPARFDAERSQRRALGEHDTAPGIADDRAEPTQGRLGLPHRRHRNR